MSEIRQSDDDQARTSSIRPRPEGSRIESSSEATVFDVSKASLVTDTCTAEATCAWRMAETSDATESMLIFYTVRDEQAEAGTSERKATSERAARRKKTGPWATALTAAAGLLTLLGAVTGIRFVTGEVHYGSTATETPLIGQAGDRERAGEILLLVVVRRGPVFPHEVLGIGGPLPYLRPNERTLRAGYATDDPGVPGTWTVRSTMPGSWPTSWRGHR